MIKRGFTYEKLISKASAKSLDDVINYVSGIGVAPTAVDIAELSAYFASQNLSLTTTQDVKGESEQSVELHDETDKKSRRKRKSSRV
jgi:hypothetical protein